VTTPVAVTATATPTAGTVSVERARELAVAEVGGGTVTGAEREVEHSWVR
jgi:hypothetical protein